MHNHRGEGIFHKLSEGTEKLHQALHFTILRYWASSFFDGLIIKFDLYCASCLIDNYCEVFGHFEISGTM